MSLVKTALSIIIVIQPPTKSDNQIITMAYRLTILPRSRLDLLSISRSLRPLTGERHHRPHGRVLLCSETSVKLKSASAASPKPAPENIGDISTVSKDDLELVHHDHEAGTGPSSSSRSLDLSFSESEIAYRSKTTLELMRSVMVLKLCQFDFLVKYNKQVGLISINMFLFLF